MAGRGPAPKDPGHRRRYNQPARSEWVDLEPLGEPLLPTYEALLAEDCEPLLAVSRWMWDLWRQDSVTSQYGPADIAAIMDLGRRYQGFKDNEQRLRMDELGLTPKGKRDLRWRTPAEVETVAKQGAKVHRLKVVTPDALARA